MLRLNNITTSVVLIREDGIAEIRKVKKCNVNEPYFWEDDYKVGLYWKTSKGGYIYFKEVSSFEQLGEK